MKCNLWETTVTCDLKKPTQLFLAHHLKENFTNYLVPRAKVLSDYL